ncbi:nuclear transport factor 2 family protein [Aminobacter sp. AP02]|uniref:nuclear transport factor 2 family protein n=1 Tax=Aminobacter sp. AP02 TaxID=2135737 RepID=UPI000D6AC101|nr:nuclear transport factor 2 family protein [Aminobacter sp. AP02]PWK73952.1 SnoaL-like protein [Aminobacter sp. AP02]
MADDQAALLMAIALRRVSERYACAVDCGDGDLLAAQFTPDGVVESPRGKFVGPEQLSGIPAMVANRYLKTFHAVLNQMVEPIEGGAEGETYCIARHYFHDPAGRYLCYEMTIRYQDRFARTSTGWKLSRRALTVVGTHTYEAQETPN